MKDVIKIDERNYGIDLLRIIAMLYVVILHTLGQGGVLNAAVVNSSQYSFSWFMETWAYGAVDIFALISGYVGYSEQEKKYNFSAYLVMWLQVVSYGVIATLIFNGFHPELVTKKDLYQMFFPVTNGLYWYFTAYTGLFIIIPFLNMGVRKCSEEYLKKLFIGLLIIFTVFDKVANRFILSAGYSFVWVTILYIMGAIIKKCKIGKNMKGYQLLVGIIVSCLICWGWKIYGKEFKIFEITVKNNFLVSYTSLGILATAIFHLIGFSKMKFTEKYKKMIAFAAPGAFAVYILNCQRFIWNYGMAKRFVYLADKSIPMILFHVLGFSILFVTGSILIDRIRIKMFEICKIKQISKWLTEIVDKVLTWCTSTRNVNGTIKKSDKYR